MKKKKLSYLRVDRKKKFNLNLSSLDPFFTDLKNGDLSLNLQAFAVLSIASGVIVYLLYLACIKTPFLALIAGLLATTIPYLYYKTPALMAKMVDQAVAYKNFISILQSSLRATNSTREALLMTANEKGLSTDLKEIMQNVVSEIRLGSPIETVLDNAIAASYDPYFKMAMTIVRVNHKVGSATTIDALENIQKNMNLRIDNIQLLKDKINSSMFAKGFFLAFLMAAPLVEAVYTKELTAGFYASLLGQTLIAGVMIVAYIGQFLMDYFAFKAIKEL